MRRVALATLLLLAACAGPDGSPGPAPSSPEVASSDLTRRGDWSAPRVGDRVELRFEQRLTGVVGEAVSRRVAVEVVKVEPALAWLRLGVVDDPSRDVLVPMGLGRSPQERSAARETVRAAGRTFECEVHAYDPSLPDGGLWRAWLADARPLYLVDGVVRNRARDDAAVRTFELTALRAGEPGAAGALPSGVRVLFEPGAWWIVEREGDGAPVHVQRAASAGLFLYAEAPLAPLAEGAERRSYTIPSPITDDDGLVAFHTEQGGEPRRVEAHGVLDLLRALALGAPDVVTEAPAGRVVAQGRYE